MSFIPLGFLAASGAAAGNFQSIATVTVGAGGSSSVSFNSISAGFKHLQLRVFTATSPYYSNGGYLEFNGDTTGSNYDDHWIYGTGSSAGASYDSAYQALFNLGSTSGFNAGVIDVLDYTNTNKYKVSRALSGYDTNGSGYMNFASGLWKNTAAINSIRIFPGGAGVTFSEHSSFALYGVK